jgi:hypothetical protein
MLVRYYPCFKILVIRSQVKRKRERGSKKTKEHQVIFVVQPTGLKPFRACMSLTRAWEVGITQTTYS